MSHWIKASGKTRPFSDSHEAGLVAAKQSRLSRGPHQLPSAWQNLGANRCDLPPQEHQGLPRQVCSPTGSTIASSATAPSAR